MVLKQMTLIDLEKFLCGYLKWGSNFTSGGHMKRKPIDVGSKNSSTFLGFVKKIVYIWV